MKAKLELSKRQLFALEKLTRTLGKRYVNFLGTGGLAKVIHTAFIKDISGGEYESLKDAWLKAEPKEIKEKLEQENKWKEAGGVLSKRD